MVLSSSIVSVAAALVALVGQVNAHGYMYIPLAEFTDSETSAWVVQIEPQWSGDWDSCSSDDSDCLTTLYSSLKSSNGYSDIRTLLDNDTSLYGADCGFTNPDATAKDPPTTGDATFSRGMQESTSAPESSTSEQESTSAPESSTSEQESTSAPESSTSEQESTSAPESSTSESSQATTSYSFGEQSTEAPSSNSEESKKSDEDESDKKSDEDESDKKSDGDDDNDDDRQRLRQ
ncbi:hypothetical protein PRNP1_004866 [Phytophthora ramorum]